METFNHDGSDPFGMQLEDVQRVTVLGAGNMGHGIAEVAALAGYDMALRDIEEGVRTGWLRPDRVVARQARRERPDWRR